MMSFTFHLLGTTSDNSRSGELFELQLAAYPKCTLSEDFGKLLTEPALEFSSDLTFLVGPDRVPVHGHSAIVAARCSCIKDLLLSTKEDKKDKQECCLPEIDLSAFKLVLEYLYTDQITLDRDRAFSTEVIMDIMKVYTLSISLRVKNTN